MNTNTEQIIQQLFTQVSQHLETRWEYFTLTSTEKMSKLLANIAGAMVIFIFAVLVLFFFSMGFAWWLGSVIGSLAGGFALSGLLFIPIAFLIFRWIRPFVRTKIMQSILTDELETINE
jgi:Putative Actinobacterial Holin-X, holin superfamily III